MSTKQKTAWASEIIVVDAKTGEEINVGRLSYGLSDMTNAFTEAANECRRVTVALAAIIRLYKRPKRLNTGITPKIHNRTRKKQRLTRLQRRQKRQCK